jgi:hypothetical protein
VITAVGYGFDVVSVPLFGGRVSPVIPKWRRLTVPPCGPTGPLFVHDVKPGDWQVCPGAHVAEQVLPHPLSPPHFPVQLGVHLPHVV